jgi:preprotein translocase subunit SecA
VALADADGPWKLLAWLEQVQPTLLINKVLVPSFVYQLMLDHLKEQKVSGADATQKALIDVANKSLEAEEQHLLHSLDGLLETSQTRLETQLDEKLETIDIFMQGLRLEEEGQQRSPSILTNELGTLLVQPLKLDNAQQKLLREEPEKAADLVYGQVAQSLRSQAVLRLIGALERRLEIELNLKPDDLAKLEWNEIGEQLNLAVNEEFKQRRERLVGEGGQITKEIHDSLASAGADIHDGTLLQSLISMPESRVTSFDKKSHQQVVQRRRRLSLAFYAAKFLEKMEAEDITEKVLAHLQNAQRATQTIWGLGAWESIASRNPAELNEAARDILKQAVGAEGFEKLNGQPLSALADDARQKVVQELGRRTLNESYRQLLLRVISELWVDYLTRMEALRISISLEAYAQRDPLVEYKAKAYKMFQDLFADMRSSLVNRMFIFTPGAPGQAQQAAPQPPAQIGAPTNGSGNGASQQKAPVAADADGGQEESGKRKRKRHKKH